MGSDDLFKKRKSERIQARASKKRDRSKRYLIVCEDEKSSLYYFKEMCEAWRINAPIVTVEPSRLGASPDRVLEHALACYDEERRCGEPYDEVFCVMDRDTHTTFYETLRKIDNLKKRKNPKPVSAIVSYPCYEIWLLLHFGYTRHPFQIQHENSAADMVIKVLKEKPGLENYEKNQRRIFACLNDRLEDALKNARRAQDDATRTGEDNPSTQIYLLVEKFQALAKTRG